MITRTHTHTHAPPHSRAHTHTHTHTYTHTHTHTHTRVVDDEGGAWYYEEQESVLVFSALIYQCMRPSATSV